MDTSRDTSGIRRYFGPGALQIIPSNDRLRNCGPETVAVICECGKARTHRIADLQRGFHPTTAIDDLEEHLTGFCRRGNPDCRAEYVSPDDGCAQEG